METVPRALGKSLPRSFIETAGIRYREREAVYCTSTGRRFTFGELDRRANRLAHALLSLGYRKGSVVGVVCSNRVELYDFYFALAKTGIVGLPLNYRLAPAEIVALLHAMNAEGLITEERFAATAAYVRERLPAVKHLIWVGSAPPPAALDYERLLADASDANPVASIEEHDPYYFNLTSGTTGLPKSYVLTHFNATPIALFALAFDVRPEDVILTLFPAFGRVGMAWLTVGLVSGARNVLANFDVAQALKLIESEQVTVTNLVPTMAAMMLASPDLPQHSLASLRHVVFAGATLPAPIREATQRQICPSIYEYYGMQETGALTISDPEDRKRRPDSVGRIGLFSALQVVTPDGSPAAIGEIGEIVGASPAAATGYYGDPARSAETFRDGWIHTGDLGRLDAEGYLFICGRKKDMIITGGQNVFAAEVEEVLLEFDGVIDCAVFPIPDGTWGECVTAVVVTREGRGIPLQELQSFCRARLAGFKIPRRLHVQHTPLPRTPTGKVQKFLLIERYGADTTH